MIRGAALGVLLLALVNIGFIIVYRGKVPPHTYLGNQQVGGLSYQQVRAQPANFGIEQFITLSHATASKQIEPSELGLLVDIPASVKHLQSNYMRWFPMLGFVKKTTVPVTLRVDELRYQQGIQALSPQFNQAAQDVHVAFDGKAFVSASATNGYAIDASATKRDVLKAIASGQRTLQIPTTVVQATVHNIDLSSDIATLNKQLAIAVSYATFSGSKAQPSLAQKASWFVPSGQTMALSGERIGVYLTQVGAEQHLELINTSDLVTATSYALTRDQALDFRLVTQGNILRTYCTAVRGVDQSALGDLTDKLAAVYADARGWNDEGRIGFQHVTSGCQYTVWLSAADQMTSFGSICDDYYNCQAGQNVVVNDDRWLHATPSWNASGGSLEDYHILIIDHETGHRLGFLDNPTCPSPGQPAYVMMQQSIDLKGCVFNVWPTATELQDLKTML